MSSNSSVPIIKTSDIDMNNQLIFNTGDNIDNNNFKKELIKVLEKGLERIASKFLTIENEEIYLLLNDIRFSFLVLVTELKSLRNKIDL